jgi:plasmid maintenance system antidote protein VapI
MELNSNNDALLPSAVALKDSLSQKPDVSPETMMLTAYQQELLRQFESEIVNGKRSITKEQAKRLGALFGVSPAVFI